MEAADFRSFMIGKVRAFDAWAWIDEKDNPQDYVGMTEASWFKLFLEFMEGEVD